MTDLLLLRLIGLVFLAFGLGMLISPSFYKKMMDDFLNNAAVCFLGGLMSLVIGFILVMYHNIWTGDWGLIITVVAWISLIKGVLLMIFPKFHLNMARSMWPKKSLVAMGIIVAIIGLIILFVAM